MPAKFRPLPTGTAGTSSLTAGIKRRTRAIAPEVLLEINPPKKPKRRVRLRRPGDPPE